ncbi:MAG: HAMP domain-containing histidine kinase [Alphaproteobacteria bacterium]|nr:HAMP domain-containing histidine kinase [Alphaproteobacteria bacterium]
MQCILGPVGNKQYQDYATHIRQAGGHLLDVINDILDLAKIESGQLQMNEQQVDVPQVVEACVRLLKARALAKGIELHATMEGKLLPIRADERLLEQVLINLVSNGIKFRPEGGTVVVKSSQSDADGHTFEVVDTGVGIANDDIPMTLEPFRQADGALNCRNEGTGLGLPLSKSYVPLHDGSLELVSKPGSGTVARVRLPASRLLNGIMENEAAQTRSAV